MGFNRENYRKIKREYEGKNLRAKEQAEARRAELHAAIPELASLDRALSQLGLQIFETFTRYGGQQLEAELARLKAENADLLVARADCLSRNGYPSDYSDVKYECPLCMDTGFVELKMCRCMKEKLILAGYESSGI
ncbi:MAG: hypothetical protein E7618_05620, partial [Ruminococcaceae bacterium]|nr:hypothetical protein [Oscillospiraceae bacterium]